MFLMPRFSHYCLAVVMLFTVAVTPRAQDAPSERARPAVEVFSLGPGDVVRVLIWREKDLSGDFKVDQHGQLTLPMLGARQVTRMPWEQVYDSLMTEFHRLLKTTSVTLTPLRPVYVLGEVTKPGLYLADPTLRLAGVVALAGGANPQGDINRIRVVRDGRNVLSDVAIESQLMQLGVLSQDIILVDRRGWFDRNSAFVAGAAISIASIVVTLVRR